MSIGVAKVRLRLPENGSLKGKRQVLKSIISRVQARFAVSIAEVENNDRWQVATLGLACVSNDARHANEVISKAVAFIEQARFDAEFLGYETELIQAL